jgi:hypothetical protein
MREEMWKEKEDRWLKKINFLGTIVNWAVQRIVEKCSKTQFVAIGFKQL